MTDAEWERDIAANLTGGFRLAREAARRMAEAGYGRILFTASINGMIVRPGMVGYAAAKTGLFGLVRGLAVDWRVAASRSTPSRQAISSPTATPDAGRGPRLPRPHRRPHPGRPLGKPPELAAAALYLVSRAASFTTGTVLTVDGGMTAAI